MPKRTRVISVAWGALAVIASSYGLQRARDTAALSARRNAFKSCVWALTMEPHAAPRATNRNAMGKDVYSWRLEQHLLLANSGSNESPPGLSRVNVAWDDPSNQEFREESGPTEFCYDGENHTCVFAITGPGTAFDEAAASNWEEVNEETIIIVEVFNSQTHWMAPGNFDIRSIPNTINSAEEIGISSKHRGGAHIGFADGEVWFISETVPFDELKNFFTIDGARMNNRESLLGKYRIH
ncbi:MAG: DUF1559 domain-containing protein [Planctomycetaceae bacterium]|jgi:prepilin-type processing-associated H-X9-DG protein|nr:DUF1559 domain-containing protein [Planctomycetaceae bacterium]MBT6487796.1 DUF1559 domain-containing protein [Planctomycetaceae bacterium]MBT6497302.1 DUF1559 domain-containing protein [Planctomycetaceae bacterium]